MRFFSKLVTSLPLIAGICCTTSAAAIRRAVDSEGLAWSILDLADMSHNVTEILYHCEERDKNDPFWQDVGRIPPSDENHSCTNTYPVAACH